MTLVRQEPVLLATKLLPPQRRGLVPRPRLLDRLRPTGHRLTVLDAPAGWGKTSLLAQWPTGCCSASSASPHAPRRSLAPASSG